MLAKDDYWDIRIEVAKNKHISSEAIAILVTDCEVSVRFYVAQNPNIPLKALETLTNDTDDAVRSIASKILKKRMIKNEQNMVR